MISNRQCTSPGQRNIVDSACVTIRGPWAKRRTRCHTPGWAWTLRGVSSTAQKKSHILLSVNHLHDSQGPFSRAGEKFFSPLQPLNACDTSSDCWKKDRKSSSRIIYIEKRDCMASHRHANGGSCNSSNSETLSIDCTEPWINALLAAARYCGPLWYTLPKFH